MSLFIFRLTSKNSEELKLVIGYQKKNKQLSFPCNSKAGQNTGGKEINEGDRIMLIWVILFSGHGKFSSVSNS